MASSNHIVEEFIRKCEEASLINRGYYPVTKASNVFKESGEPLEVVTNSSDSETTNTSSNTSNSETTTTNNSSSETTNTNSNDSGSETNTTP